MIGTQQELSRFPKYLNEQDSRDIILNTQFFLNRKRIENLQFQR